MFVLIEICFICLLLACFAEVVLGKTIGTTHDLTLITGLSAPPTDARMAALTLVTAAMAQPTLADFTGVEAIETEVPLAALAKRPVVLGNESAAIVAGGSFPFG